MPVCPLPLRIWLCTPYHMRIEACECRFMNIMSCRPTCEPAGAAPKASGQPRQTVKVVVADRKGSRDQAECAAMDPLHPPSTSIGWSRATMRQRTSIGSFDWLDGDVDGC